MADDLGIGLDECLIHTHRALNACPASLLRTFLPVLIPQKKCGLRNDHHVERRLLTSNECSKHRRTMRPKTSRATYRRPFAVCKKHSALDDVQCKSGQAGLLIARLHVESGLIHGLDHLVERDLVRFGLVHGDA